MSRAGYNFSSSPFARRCVEGGFPSPCWWWRRCRARWWGPPSRTGWGSLGEERRGQSRGGSWPGLLFTCRGCLKPCRPQTHHLPMCSQRVQQRVWTLLGEVWVGAEPEGAGQQRGVEGRSDLRHLGSWLWQPCQHSESKYPGRFRILKDKERSVKSLGLWLE